MKKKILLTLLVLVIIGVVAGALFLWPTPFKVERSISVGVTPEKAFSVIEDFNQWQIWSPWLVQEPAAKVTVSGDGKSVGDVYSWEGDLIGQGELEHQAIDSPKSTDMEIRFIKPFASTGKVGFRVSPDPGNANAANVTWMMTGKIPRFLKAMTAAWIEKDYDRGLSMLKEYCETGQVITKIEVTGEVDRPKMSYIGIKGNCDYANISESMGKSFDELLAKLTSVEIEPEGQFLAIYTKFDTIKNHVEYIAAYPVTSSPRTIPEGIEFGDIPAHKAFQVNHLGPYRNVGNGWATGMQHVLGKGMKQSKTVMPYEMMPVDENAFPEAEIRSEIFFPLR